MTKEREEFEQIMVSFTSPDNDYFSANIGSADNIDELWSWHQQSLDRAVREERERIKKEVQEEYSRVEDMEQEQLEEDFECEEAVATYLDGLGFTINSLTPPVDVKSLDKK